MNAMILFILGLCCFLIAAIVQQFKAWSDIYYAFNLIGALIVVAAAFWAMMNDLNGKNK